MTKTLWDLLETPPANCEAIANLVSWSMNEDARTGTALLAFLDLIGYSAEHYGEPQNHPNYRPGYLEMDYLADALKEYADNPGDAWDFVCEIVTADE
jgi:predicted AlkP superfamily pyrophosphatase or phosphodiesterase